MKKILSNRGQLSLEFALLLAGVVAVASIASFYYIKTTESSSITAKKTVVKSDVKVNNEVIKKTDEIKEFMVKEK